MGTRRRRHTPQQITASSERPSDCWVRGARWRSVAKAFEVSEQTFRRWRAQYGGMKAEDVRRLKELERENGQLKRIVADQ